MVERWHCDKCGPEQTSFYRYETTTRSVYFDEMEDNYDFGDDFDSEFTDDPVKCTECDYTAEWEDRSTMAIMGESIDETPS